MAAKTVFVRDATGLVRNLSLFDQMNVNLSFCSPPQGVLWAWTFGAGIVSAANLNVSYMLAAVIVAVGSGMVYALWTIAMPRTGADYIWFSRAVHPSYGFVISWYVTFLFLIWYGGASQMIGPWGMAPVFLSLGMTDAAAAVSSAAGSVIIGTVFNILVVLLFLSGMRSYARVFRILFAASLAGTLFFIGVLLSSSNAGFVSGFNSFVKTTSYQAVMDTAKGAGWIPGWALTGSLLAMLFPFQNYGWGGFSAYVAGESKRVDKSAFWAILGGLGVMCIWYVAMGLAIYSIAGQDFWSALTWTWSNAPNSYPLSFAPYPSNMLLFLTSNKVILGLSSLGFLLSVIYVVPVQVLPATRNLFAWSFDRVLPTKLAEVNDRFHSPVYAILTCAIIGEFLLFIIAFTSLISVTVSALLVGQIPMIMVGVASMIVPYKKKKLFESFHPKAKMKLFGIPVMTISGAIMTTFAISMLYACFIAPTGLYQYSSMIFSGVVLLLAIPVFYASYFYQKKKGLDLMLAFKEIPPE